MIANLKFQYLFTALIFIFFSAIHFAIDLIMPILLEESSVSELAKFKALIFVISPLLLLGLDQTVIRTGNFEPSFQKKIFFSFSIGALAYIALNLIFDRDYIYGFSGYVINYFIIILVSILLLLSAYFRSKLQYNQSQFIANSWKVVMLLSIIIFSNNTSYIYLSILAFLLFLVIASGSILFYGRNNLQTTNKRNEKNVSSIFFWLLVTLNISSYADQILLSSFGEPKELVIYLTHLTIFGSPWLIFSLVISFYLSPYLAKLGKDKSLNLYKRYGLFVLVLTLSIFIIYSLLGTKIFEILYGEKYDLNNTLLILILLTFFIRIFYGFLSGLIGMTFERNKLKIFLSIAVAGTILQISSFFFMSFIMEINIILSGGISTLLNWFIRTFGAINLVLER